MGEVDVIGFEVLAVVFLSHTIGFNRKEFMQIIKICNFTECYIISSGMTAYSITSTDGFSFVAQSGEKSSF